MRPYGRIFFRGFSQGIPVPRRSSGRALYFLSFDAIAEQGQRKEWQSERQKSWLSKDCAETAIGSR